MKLARQFEDKFHFIGKKKKCVGGEKETGGEFKRGESGEQRT